MPSRKNSPDTEVYNECANEMLKRVIKANVIHAQPSSNEDRLPTTKDIDCIVAGFPW